MKKDKIKITSKIDNELSSAVIVGEKKYIVQTERESPENFRIITRIYLKGGILSTIKNDCRDRADTSDIENRMHDFMEQQHRLAVKTLEPENAECKVMTEETAEAERIEAPQPAATVAGEAAKTGEVQAERVKTPSDYLDTVKTLLARKNQKNALALLNDALELYPDDPFLLSYYGYLEAVVKKSHKHGIEACKKAFGALKEKMPFGEEFFYPVLFLNLGRAYVAAGKRKNALEAFSRGLAIDSGNADIIRELKKVGIRKRPPIPFLDRSNPINKYMGKFLYKVKK